MKLSLWNSKIRIIAETHQDIAWLGNFVQDFDEMNIIDNYIQYMSGELDWDDKLTVDSDELTLKEAKELVNNEIVGITIEPYGHYIPEWEMKMIKIDYEHMKQSHEKWKDKLKKEMPDRYKEVVDYENDSSQDTKEKENDL